jgi:hypothetical protein
MKIIGSLLNFVSVFRTTFFFAGALAFVVLLLNINSTSTVSYFILITSIVILVSLVLYMCYVDARDRIKKKIKNL